MVELNHRRLQTRAYPGYARVDWLTGLYDALIAVITSDVQQHDWQDSRNGKNYKL